MSTISFLDDDLPAHSRSPGVKMENTYQLEPEHKLSRSAVTQVIQDTLDTHLQHVRYEPDGCRQTATILADVRLYTERLSILVITIAEPVWRNGRA